MSVPLSPHYSTLSLSLHSPTLISILFISPLLSLLPSLTSSLSISPPLNRHSHPHFISPTLPITFLILPYSFPTPAHSLSLSLFLSLSLSLSHIHSPYPSLHNSVSLSYSPSLPHSPWTHFISLPILARSLSPTLSLSLQLSLSPLLYILIQLSFPPLSFSLSLSLSLIPLSP